jgi:hypothetical protein
VGRFVRVVVSFAVLFVVVPAARAADDSQASKSDWKESSVADLPSAAVEPSPPAAVTKPADASVPPATGAGLRTAGIVTASAGLATVVTGIILNIKANDLAHEMASTPSGYSAGKDSDRKTYKTLALTGYGVGAACVVTGTILYILGRDSRASGSAALTIAPMLAHAQAGALLQGAF